MVKKKFNVPFDKTKSNENKIVTFDIDNNEISIYNYDWDLKFDKSSYRLSFVPLQKLIVHFQMGKTKKKKNPRKKKKEREDKKQSKSKLELNHWVEGCYIFLFYLVRNDKRKKTSCSFFIALLIMVIKYPFDFSFLFSIFLFSLFLFSLFQCNARVSNICHWERLILLM